MRNENMFNHLFLKKITLFFVISSFFLFSLTSCNDDSVNKKEALVGKFTWTEWQQKAGWDDYEAADYIPDSNVIENLKIIDKEDIRVIIFTSNWCPDCSLQMPRIMKIFKQIGIDYSVIDIYGLSYDKKEPTNEYLKYEIKWVPTIIILRNNNIEMGRIVETPEKTLEDDLYYILSLKHED